jgi:hypothetical protein
VSVAVDDKFHGPSISHRNRRIESGDSAAAAAVVVVVVVVVVDNNELDLSVPNEWYGG